MRKPWYEKQLLESTKKKAIIAYKMYLEEAEMSVKDICKTVGLSRSSLYIYLRQQGHKLS